MSVGMPKPENKRTIDKRFTARLLGRSECLCTRVLLRLEFQVAHPILNVTLANSYLLTKLQNQLKKLGTLIVKSALNALKNEVFKKRQ